jgi:hypothetical protein
LERVTERWCRCIPTQGESVAGLDEDPALVDAAEFVVLAEAAVKDATRDQLT